ncbi:MAG: Protease HtpX [Parcubacteria group bacterium]|nr:Protease HtpX [Parcubacteria group bacterium]
MALTLYQERSRNVWRTALLMTVFLAIVVGIGYFVSYYYQSPGILYVAVVFAVFMNVYSYWFSDRQVLSMTNARPASREEFFDFYTVTENLAITAGIQMPKLYVIDDPAPNAFATGRNEKHAVVAATTGLLSMMTRPELEGVIAHELSHIRNRDMLLMTVAVVLAGFIAIIADIFLRVSFWGGGSRDDNSKGGGLLLILGIVALVLAPIAAQLIQLAISRRREFLADASGALLTRYPEGLATALEKISGYGRPMLKVSHATSHLFIGDPYGPKAGDWINRLFSTHPPTADRVKALLGRS